jgi:hypothetical protein
MDDLWLGIGIIVPSLINSVTKHYSQYKGLAKVLTFVSELFSFVVSREVDSHSGLKLPFTSKRPFNG